MKTTAVSGVAIAPAAIVAAAAAAAPAVAGAEFHIAFNIFYNLAVHLLLLTLSARHLVPLMYMFSPSCADLPSSTRDSTTGYAKMKVTKALR